MSRATVQRSPKAMDGIELTSLKVEYELALK